MCGDFSTICRMLVEYVKVKKPLFWTVSLRILKVFGSKSHPLLPEVPFGFRDNEAANGAFITDGILFLYGLKLIWNVIISLWRCLMQFWCNYDVKPLMFFIPYHNMLPCSIFVVCTRCLYKLSHGSIIREKIYYQTPILDKLKIQM